MTQLQGGYQVCMKHNQCGYGACPRCLEESLRRAGLDSTTQTETFGQLVRSAGIGDINSDAKGSGARFNTGKPPYDLVPLALVGASLQDPRWYPTDAENAAATALIALGDYQSRRRGTEALYDMLRVVGLEGWDECAQVFDYGRGKYAAWNWAKGMAWSVPIACAARHLKAMQRGEPVDPESGRPHRGHVFCNGVMLLTYASTFPEGDDRPAAGLLTPEAV
jgi:hypothetical protein